MSGRGISDFLLFGVTAAELTILFFLTPTFDAGWSVYAASVRYLLIPELW